MKQKKTQSPKKKYRFEGLTPLKFAPKKIAESLERQAKMIDRSMRAAIKIKCIECSGWSRPEAKTCRIKTCGLYPHNRKIFAKKEIETVEEDYDEAPGS